MFGLEIPNLSIDVFPQGAHDDYNYERAVEHDGGRQRRVRLNLWPYQGPSILFDFFVDIFPQRLYPPWNFPDQSTGPGQGELKGSSRIDLGRYSGRLRILVTERGTHLHGEIPKGSPFDTYRCSSNCDFGLANLDSGDHT